MTRSPQGGPPERRDVDPQAPVEGSAASAAGGAATSALSDEPDIEVDMHQDFASAAMGAAVAHVLDRQDSIRQRRPDRGDDRHRRRRGARRRGDRRTVTRAD